MIDIPAILRADLLADPAIAALVGSRVWASRTTPEQGYTPADGAGLCVSIRGGSELNYSGVDIRASIQVQCYGATPLQANDLYRAVFDRLHIEHAPESGRAILGSTVEQLGQALEEPQTDWPFVLGFFNTIFRNKE